MDANKMNVVELKALAYDIAVQREQLTGQLQQINNLIAKGVQDGVGKTNTGEGGKEDTGIEDEK